MKKADQALRVLSEYEAGEVKLAKAVVKQIDSIGDNLESIEKINKKALNTKILKRLGLDDSRSKSDAKVEELTKKVEDAIEDLQYAFADLANAIDTYHL